MADARPSVARAVRRLRLARGLTQAELARLAGLKRATVAQVEAHGNPTMRTALALRTVLGVMLDDLAAGLDVLVVGV